VPFPSLGFVPTNEVRYLGDPTHLSHGCHGGVIRVWYHGLVNVSVEANVALPARLRPTPDQVCNWYAHTLGAIGADVWRSGPDQLEFTLPFSRTFLDANPASSLAPLAGGELEVAETADGFEVSVRARSRDWVSYLPIAVFAGTTGGLAYLGTPIGYLPALAGMALLGFTWLRSWGALRHFLSITNDAIAESFAAVPPAVPGLSAPTRRT
jgi:hypothetical protein